MTDHETWRQVCPDISDGEITALEGLPASDGGVGAQLLAAYRAGVAHGRATGHHNLRIGAPLGSKPPPRAHVPHVDTPDGAVRFLVDLVRDRHVAETRYPRVVTTSVDDVPDGPVVVPSPEPENVTGPVIRTGHHRDCTWLGPREGWRCIRGCPRLLEDL